jgi:hypothetical protein
MVKSSRIGVEEQVRRHSTFGCYSSTFPTCHAALLALSWQKGSIAGLFPKSPTLLRSFEPYAGVIGKQQAFLRLRTCPARVSTAFAKPAHEPQMRLCLILDVCLRGSCRRFMFETRTSRLIILMSARWSSVVHSLQYCTTFMPKSFRRRSFSQHTATYMDTEVITLTYEGRTWSNLSYN